jgi:hypothetical protein
VQVRLISRFAVGVLSWLALTGLAGLGVLFLGVLLAG